VKVTLVPEQIAPVGLTVMPTVTAEGVLTVIVIVLEVAGDPVTQVKLLVITQVIASVFAKVLDE
jgi:H+/Cl- antiporter ClcA